MAIDAEIEKKRPNIKKLVSHMKEIRREKVFEIQEKRKRDALTMKKMSSSSVAGKIIE